MAEAQKDIFSQLAERGEQFVGRITDLPAAKTLVDKTSALAKNVDSMQKQLRSLGPLEKRVAAIERRLDKLEGKGSTTRKRTPTRKTTAAKPKSTTRRRPPPKAS
jgi:hypothetical protein